MKILLTGATGYIGGRLLQKLLEQGYFVRCLVRSPAFLKKYKHASLEVVQGDVLEKHSLDRALKEMDVAYYLVHSMGEKAGFIEKEKQGAKNFGLSCKENQVKKIIYLGGLGDHSYKTLSDHLKSRHEVGNILRKYAEDVQVIEFRASIILGAGSLSFEMVRALSERLPVMITPKWVWTKAQPIYIEDILSFLLAALKSEVSKNPIYEIGGKDQVSYADLMIQYSKLKNLKRIMIPVPFLTPWLSSLWLGLVTPLYARVGRKLVESACYPTVVKDCSANRIFGIDPIGVFEGLKKALEAEEKERPITRWIDSLSAAGIQPKVHLAQGTHLIDSRMIAINVSPKEAFTPIRLIGGSSGWYYSNFLWRFRGMFDLLLGGVGYRRGRKDPEEIAVGDVIDFWRVEEYEPDHLLRLRAEMKLPGKAWLEFQVEGMKECSTIRQTAFFDSHGLSGLLYWYILYPFHRTIFRGMLRNIAKKARKKAWVISEFEKKDPNVLSFFYWSFIAFSSEEVFRWHKQKGAFLRLIPPWIKMSVEKVGDITNDSETIFILKNPFFSIRWVVKNSSFIDGKQFVDVQEKGPFSFWHHTHSFFPFGEKTSFIVDSLYYKLPFGKIGQFFFANFVEKQFIKMFHYRQSVIQADLERWKKGKPMRILVSGASGFIGSALTPFLQGGGHQVVKLVRHSPVSEDEIFWNPYEQKINFDRLEGFDAVINLVGENISTGSWTEEKKRKILESRVVPNRFLKEIFQNLRNPPETFISASAIGIYGSRGSEVLTEDSQMGNSFLADVCKEWEKEAFAIETKKTRVVVTRFGIVLHPKGGALAKMLPIFKWGLGGKIGNGNQYMSWIALEDILGIYAFILQNKEIKGAINATSSHPVTNTEFTHTLGSVLKRPTFFTVPECIAKLAFGEMAEEMLLASVRAFPKILENEGFVFRYPELKQTLKDMLEEN